MSHTRAAYLHIPFCAAKCYYCEFNSYPAQEPLFDDYVRAIQLEILCAKDDSPLSTVYFGGGTPTVLSFAQLKAMLDAVYDKFGVDSDAEITIEANPCTVDISKLSALRESGFNRLSLGVQSLDDDMLQKLGRIHSTSEALDAYSNARKAGFENIGIDLMFALPNQTIFDWRAALSRAMDLFPEHISLYELSIGEGTKFAELYTGSSVLPDEDLKLEMYQATIDTLTTAGYEHYEVSNFARPGFRSRHNQVYWQNKPYCGFGAGATSYIDGVRSTNIKSPKDYIDSLLNGGSPVDSSEVVSKETSMGETVMLALRTADGLNRLAFKERYALDVTDVYREQINRFAEAELIELTSDSLRLTCKGLYLADEIAQEFLP